MGRSLEVLYSPWLTGWPGAQPRRAEWGPRAQQYEHNHEPHAARPARPSGAGSALLCAASRGHRAAESAFYYLKREMEKKNKKPKKPPPKPHNENTLTIAVETG